MSTSSGTDQTSTRGGGETSASSRWALTFAVLLIAALVLTPLVAFVYPWLVAFGIIG